MSRRIARCLVATTLAVVIGLTGTTHPALATEAPSRTSSAEAVRSSAVQPLMFFDWASLIVSVASAYASSGSGSSALQNAVNQIVAAVESAKTEILNHIDRIASADIQACAREHTIEFADINNMSPTVRQLWAQNATSCAARASSYFNAVQSLSAADTIARLVPQIYAIAIAARASAGFNINLVTQDLVNTTQAITIKLKPVCETRPLVWWDNAEGAYYWEVWYECTAYNGNRVKDYEAWLHAPDSGWLIQGPLDRAWIEAEAAKNTSWPLAVAALPQLRAIPT